jgi:hypothetical protein
LGPKIRKIAVSYARNSQLFKFLVTLILNKISADTFITGRLTLVYDHKAMPDGLGAQFQRILTLKALSESIKCNFESFTLEKYDEAVFNDLNAERKLNEINKWSNLMNITSCDRRPFSISIKTNPSKLAYLYIYRFIAKITFLRIRLIIAFPAILIDKNPWIYECFGKYLNQNLLYPNPLKKMQIVVHIKRGESLLSQFKDRYLPFDYYEGLLKLLVRELSLLDIEYSITVLIEKITNPILESNNPKVINSIQIDSNNPYLIELQNGKFCLLDETFDAGKYPYLAQGLFIRNNDAFADFNLMCNADVLLISKSSFSFTAGLLNAGALKIYHPFWHTPSGRWYTHQQFIQQPKEILLKWITQNKL